MALPHRTLTPAERQWQIRAGCVGADPTLFDAESRRDLTGAGLTAARRYCDPCPVTPECAELAALDRWTGYSAGAAWVNGQQVAIKATSAISSGHSPNSGGNCKPANLRDFMEFRHSVAPDTGNSPFTQGGHQMARSVRSENSGKSHEVRKGHAGPSPRGALPKGQKPDPVVVDLTTGHCACGCGLEVTRRFRAGHDARLKSALRRAAAAGQQVKIRQGSARLRNLPAVEAAALLDNDRTSWSGLVGQVLK